MFLYKFKTIVLLLSLLTLASCTEKKKPCLFSNHPALFSSKNKGISNYSFEGDSNNTVEKLRLDSFFFVDSVKDSIKLYIPIELTILQTGCNELNQEIRLEFFDKASKMPTDYPAPDCANITAQVFAKLSLEYQSAVSFRGLAQAIVERENDFEYGKPLKLQGGFSLQIDKMHSSESTLVTVIFKKA